ncbi:serine protease [archaeon]|nr:MAG: serine protease [archaeon]
MCPRRRCSVRPEHLLALHKGVLEGMQRSVRLAQTPRFLCDEMLRRAMVRGQRGQEEGQGARERCACRVAVAFLLNQQHRALSRSSGALDSLGLFLPNRMSSGALCCVSQDGEDEALLVLTCEHLVTDVRWDSGAQRYVYGDLFAGRYPGMTAVFLVGSEAHWLYVAEVVCRGSQLPGADRRLVDLLALRLLCAIAPLPVQLAPEPDKPCTALQREQFCSASTSRLLVQERQGDRTLRHVDCPLQRAPVRASVVCEAPLLPDQFVCLLGFPQGGTMSVDYGRVYQADNGEGQVVLDLQSVAGNSGGPVLDMQGRVTGLLSRSHDFAKYSYVTPLGDLSSLLAQMRTNDLPNT